MFRSGATQVALLGTNAWVRGMQYASEVVHGQPTAFSLGTPAVGSATAIASTIAANPAANTIAALNYTSDAKFGRTLIMTISGNPGNSCVQDVYGYDYLGQPMIERFTGASGVTAVLYGKKCFYRVTQIKTITPATNAVTYNIGTGSRLGLPFQGDAAWAKEGGILVPIQKRDFELSLPRAAALAVSGGSVFVRSPCAGFVKNVFGQPFGAGSTNNPVITVKLGGTAITGLTVTLTDNDTTGARVTGVPTTAGYNANNRLVPGTPIEIVGTAAASAGTDSVGVTITPTQFLLPDTTDPHTSTTGEPRGTYDPNATLDGLTEIIVGLTGDPWVNAAGNGGLHGMKHFYA